MFIEQLSLIWVALQIHKWISFSSSGKWTILSQKHGLITLDSNKNDMCEQAWGARRREKKRTPVTESRPVPCFSTSKKRWWQGFPLCLLHLHHPQQLKLYTSRLFWCMCFLVWWWWSNAPCFPFTTWLSPVLFWWHRLFLKFCHQWNFSPCLKVLSVMNILLLGIWCHSDPLCWDRCEHSWLSLLFALHIHFQILHKSKETHRLWSSPCPIFQKALVMCKRAWRHSHGRFSRSKLGCQLLRFMPNNPELKLIHSS